VTAVRAFANAHSHAFHRALRGRVTGADSFWTWRETMYALAAALNPDLLFELAAAVYGEMRLAGIRVVGEFHYLHHDIDGHPYTDPNVMGEALIAAAREAGLHICLLDACYLAGGFSESLQGVQVRFSDGDAERWAIRVGDLAARHAGASDVVIGAAIHSVRAVPRDQLPLVATALPEAPLHVHVSEQKEENAACQAATGLTPVQLLGEAGVWTARTTAVHAIHLSDGDVSQLGAAGSYVCLCPSTEAELADGIGPTVALRDAGAQLTLGSDSNTVIDLFAEARLVEMHHRLLTGRRGAWSAAQLWDAATSTGRTSLGFPTDSEVELTSSVRTAGAGELLWAASAADVVPDRDPEAVAERLDRAIAASWAAV
jgi:formiminoglutamate deiminase